MNIIITPTTTTMMNTITIQDLPPEILLYMIESYIPIESIQNIRLVSKQFHPTRDLLQTRVLALVGNMCQQLHLPLKKIWKLWKHKNIVKYILLPLVRLVFEELLLEEEYSVIQYKEDKDHSVRIINKDNTRLCDITFWPHLARFFYGDEQKKTQGTFWTETTDAFLEFTFENDSIQIPDPVIDRISLFMQVVIKHLQLQVVWWDEITNEHYRWTESWEDELRAHEQDAKNY